MKKTMASNSKAILVAVVCFVFATVVQNVSAAPTSSKNVIEKDETIVRHKDIESRKQKDASMSTENVLTKQEVQQPKAKPVKGQPKIGILKPVPGQMETLLPGNQERLDSPPRPVSKISRQDNTANDLRFLQEGSEGREEEEEEEEEEGPEGDLYKNWKGILADPRLQTFLQSSEDQQRSDSESRIPDESVYSPELAEYLVRIGEVDRMINDLVITGVMSPREAALYREAIEMEYGAPFPPLSNEQQIVDVPEDSFEDESPEGLYEGPNNYFLQPGAPSADYSSDYVNLPVPDPFVQRERESDYGNSKEEEEELLRELLEMASLQHNEQEPPMRVYAEENIPNPNSVMPAAGPISSQLNSKNIAIEKELESLPVKTIGGKTQEAAGTEEEIQLEEIRNTKTKQDNRTKSFAKATKVVKGEH